MGSILVVIADIFAHQSLQMPFIEPEHVVRQVAAAAFHPTLCDSILPRTAKRGANRFSPHVLGRADHLIPDLCIPIGKQELLGAGIRPCFTHLLNDPKCTWSPRYVSTQNFP